MSGAPVAIGPFEGGLNLSEDPSHIADNQLAECINLDIGRAGELATRPGLKTVRTATNPISAGTHAPITILGSIVLPSLTSRLYVKQPTATAGSFNVFYSDNPEDPAGTWTQLSATFGDVRMLVYGIYDGLGSQETFAWFVPYGSVGGVATVGQAHDLTNSANLYGVNAMPRGSGGLVFKNRMFIYGPIDDTQKGTYRIYYSAVGNFTSWPVNNFFDVGPGDGDHVTAMAVQGDALVIFKRNSTWSLFFEADPFLGTLRKVNNEIGATGIHAVVTYQNEVYLISRRGIHRLVSLLFEDIGQNLGLFKIRKAHDGKDSISVIGDKIICCIDTGNAAQPYRYFVYYTESNAWSEYQFAFNPVRFVPYLDFQYSLHQFATDFSSVNLYHMHPEDRSSKNYGDSPSNITYTSLVTKRFNYDSPSTFKRLFWWAVDIVTNNRTFTLGTITDSVHISPTTLHSTTEDVTTLIKTKMGGRFRNIQYVVRSSTVNGYLRIRGGEARISGKREVDNATN